MRLQLLNSLLFASIVASAQTSNVTIVTSPTVAATPSLSTLGIVALALALSAFAFHTLRNRIGSTFAALVVVGVLGSFTAMKGINNAVDVQIGAGETKSFTIGFNVTTTLTNLSGVSQTIRSITLALGVTNTGTCQVGTVLPVNGTCTFFLPGT